MSEYAGMICFNLVSALGSRLDAASPLEDAVPFLVLHSRTDVGKRKTKKHLRGGLSAVLLSVSAVLLPILYTAIESSI